MFSQSSFKKGALLLTCLVFMQLGLLRSQDANAESAANLTKTYCLACHQVDKKIVGPSFVEMASIYKDNPGGLVLWAMNPGKKRPETIQMPSMAFIGEEKLTRIAEYILKEAEGKEEVQSTGSVSSEIPSLVDPARPKVQRIFMPDASPASIAVAMPGNLSYCWDSTSCKLRYVWKGQFIEPMPVWKGNGNGLAKIMGEKVLITGKPSQAFFKSDSQPKFMGYRTIDGLPEFTYMIGSQKISELILPLNDGSGITQIFTITSAGSQVIMDLSYSSNHQTTVSTGTLDNGIWRVDSSPHNVISLTTKF